MAKTKQINYEILDDYDINNIAYLSGRDVYTIKQYLLYPDDYPHNIKKTLDDIIKYYIMQTYGEEYINA